MQAQRRHHPGNTLSEYSLLIGLIAVASIVSLALLGNTLSNSFGGFAHGLKRDASQGLTANANPAVKALNMQPIGAAGSGVGPSGITAKTTDFQLNTATAGGGKNITASDGKVSFTVNTTLNASRSLLAMAQSLDPDSSLYNILISASQQSFMMAGNEASYSQNVNGVTGLDAIALKGLSGAETLREVHNNYLILSQTIQELNNKFVNSSTVSGQEKTIATQAVSMLQQSINSMWSTYSQLKDYTYGSGNGINNLYLDTVKLEADAGGHMMNTYDNMAEAQTAYTQLVKNAAPTLINSGAVDSNTAIRSSLQTGLTTDSMTTTAK